MSVFIQLLFSLLMSALVGTAFKQFSQIGIDTGFCEEACSGFGTDLDFLGVATA
jgi:hypothetical protein